VAAVGRFQDSEDVTIVLSEPDRTPRISAQTADWRRAEAQEAYRKPESASKPKI
jgi:hypothetical protein